MPLKFVKQESTVTFEEDGSSITFRRPSANEITALSLHNGKKYAHAVVEIDAGQGKKPVPMLDFAIMTDAEITDMLDSDIRFAAERLVKIENVEVIDGERTITDVADLDADQKFIS